MKVSQGLAIFGIAAILGLDKQFTHVDRFSKALLHPPPPISLALPTTPSTPETHTPPVDSMTASIDSAFTGTTVELGSSLAHQLDLLRKTPIVRDSVITPQKVAIPYDSDFYNIPLLQPRIGDSFTTTFPFAYGHSDLGLPVRDTIVTEDGLYFRYTIEGPASDSAAVRSPAPRIALRISCTPSFPRHPVSIIDPSRHLAYFSPDTSGIIRRLIDTRAELLHSLDRYADSYHCYRT